MLRSQKRVKLDPKLLHGPKWNPRPVSCWFDISAWLVKTLVDDELLEAHLSSAEMTKGKRAILAMLEMPWTAENNDILNTARDTAMTEYAKEHDVTLGREQNAYDCLTKLLGSVCNSTFTIETVSSCNTPSCSFTHAKPNAYPGLAIHRGTSEILRDVHGLTAEEAPVSVYLNVRFSPHTEQQVDRRTSKHTEGCEQMVSTQLILTDESPQYLVVDGTFWQAGYLDDRSVSFRYYRIDEDNQGTRVSVIYRIIGVVLHKPDLNGRTGHYQGVRLFGSRREIKGAILYDDMQHDGAAEVLEPEHVATCLEPGRSVVLVLQKLIGGSAIAWDQTGTATDAEGED